jgi:hypothetical protein
MVSHANTPPRRAEDSAQPAAAKPDRRPTATGPETQHPAARAAHMTRRPATSRPPASNSTGILARSYKRSDGTKRRVLIAVDKDDKWLVYDVPSPAGSHADGQIVEHLIGCEDHLGQALALAEDYLQCQTAFHAGEREEQPCPDPLPKPQSAALAHIRRLYARARRVPRGEDSQQPAARIAA